MIKCRENKYMGKYKLQDDERLEETVLKTIIKIRYVFDMLM